MAKKAHTAPAAAAPVVDSTWTELKAELEALGIFKFGGWAGKHLISWVLKKNEDRFTSHFFNVFMAMPYVVVYVFERSTSELEEKLSESIIDRLNAMPRELSDEYRLQQVQGAYDALWGSKGISESEDREKALLKWIEAVKLVIREDASLTDMRWKKVLHIRNLDRPLIPESLPGKNAKLRRDVERLEKFGPFVYYGCLTLMLSIIVFGAFAVLEVSFVWLWILAASIVVFAIGYRIWLRRSTHSQQGESHVSA